MFAYFNYKYFSPLLLKVVKETHSIWNYKCMCMHTFVRNIEYYLVVATRKKNYYKLKNLKLCSQTRNTHTHMILLSWRRRWWYMPTWKTIEWNYYNKCCCFFFLFLLLPPMMMMGWMVFQAENGIKRFKR